MVLLDDKIIVYAEQTKTNVIREISAPRDFDKLVIEFEYSPKWVEDPELTKKLTLEGRIKYELVPPDTKGIPLEQCPKIGNQIVLSLDINDKFAGYAHRGNPEQVITVSERESTPGFYKMKPEKGIWKLTIAVCCVASPYCTCHIRISGLEEEKS